MYKDMLGTMETDEIVYIFCFLHKSGVNLLGC